jgi:hypothetical protein
MEHTAPRTYRYTLTGRRNGRTIRVVVHATDRVDAQHKAWDKKPGFLAYSVAVQADAPRSALALPTPTETVDDAMDREWERICDEEGIKPRMPVEAVPGIDPVDYDMARDLREILVELTG